MRERIKDKDRLQHILDAIDVLQSGAQRYSLEQIEKDSILYFGFVKQVEIIGEAVLPLSAGRSEERRRFSQLPNSIKGNSTPSLIIVSVMLKFVFSVG